MAGIASYCLTPTKKRGIDRIYDLDHAAGSALHRDIVGIFFPSAENLVAMAVGAVVTQSCGEEAHGVHKLIDGNSLQQLNILEDVLRHQRLLLRSALAAGRDAGEEHTGCDGQDSREWHAIRTQLEKPKREHRIQNTEFRGEERGSENGSQQSGGASESAGV